MTTVTAKITVLLNVRPCSLVDREQRLGEMYSHYLLCQMDVAPLSETLVCVY
jgi:hypothetical protein